MHITDVELHVDIQNGFHDAEEIWSDRLPSSTSAQKVAQQVLYSLRRISTSKVRKYSQEHMLNWKEYMMFIYN